MPLMVRFLEELGLFQHSLLERALRIAESYKQKPSSLALLAIASILIACNEVGIPVDIKRLIRKAKELGYERLSLSSLNQLLYRMDYHPSKDPLRESLFWLRRAISRMDRKVASMKDVLPTAIRHLLEIEKMNLGLSPRSKAILALLLALRRLNIKLRVYDIANAFECSESRVYRLMKKCNLMEESSGVKTNAFQSAHDSNNSTRSSSTTG